MATGQAVERDTSSEIAIFGRLIRADDSDLSRELARYILTLGFDDEDQKRRDSSLISTRLSRDSTLCLSGLRLRLAVFDGF